MLIDEIKERLANEDIDFLYDGSVQVLENEIFDQTRWSVVHRAVVHRDLEYVAVEYEVGATEYQDDTELNGEAYYVKPEVVSVIKYVRT